MKAKTLSKWVLVAAMLSAGLIHLFLGSQVRGLAAPLDHIRGAPVVKAIVPASVEITRAAASPSSAHPASPGESGTKFRFGFLEFEDDPDASAK